MEFEVEINVVTGANTGDGVLGTIQTGVTNFCSGASRVGEIYMTDVRSMVTRVIAQADGSKIRRLNVFDHGTEDGSHNWLGSDVIKIDTFETFAPFLAKLQPHFAKSAVVFLTHCCLGLNEDLVRMFALTFGVPVYACTGKYNPLFRVNKGDYIRCSPSGTIYHQVHRP